MSFQKLILIGRLGADPELRYLDNQRPVCNFSMATSEHYKEKGTNERKEITEWHNVSVYGPMGENCQKYLKKGSLCSVVGKLRTRKWTGTDGIDRYTKDVICQEITFLSSQNSGQNNGQNSGQRTGHNPYATQPNTGLSDYNPQPEDDTDDLPF